MKIQVQYCQHIRKDGTCNMVLFDTEKKVFSNRKSAVDATFIEAHVSRDVDTLRESLIEDGYEEIEALG